MRNTATGAPVRAYQVRIRDEYLECLYQFDAGSVEQEILAHAEQGTICVVTDQPQIIFSKLGDAVKSVTYMGPLVDLPAWLEGYANHWLAQRPPSSREIESSGFFVNLWQNIRTYPVRARALVTRAALLTILPLVPAARSLIKKASPRRAIHALRTREDG